MSLPLAADRLAAARARRRAACASACCSTPARPAGRAGGRRGGRGGGASVRGRRRARRADRAVHDARHARRHGRLLAHALVARHRGAAARSDARKVLPFIVAWVAARRDALGRARVPRLQPDGRRCARPRSRACRPFDFVLSPTSPIAGLRRRAGERRPTTRERPFEHIAFTRRLQHERAAGREHQLRLDRATACRSACRSSASGTTTSACCRSRAPGKRLRPAPRPWPEPPAPLTPRRAMTRRDARGNPVSHRARAAALAASERALWRMMSFYGTPIDDLDAAIAADPRWPLPRVMKAGFLLSLTEPSLRRRGARAARRGAEPLGRRAATTRERAHLAALRPARARRLARRAADAGSALLRRAPARRAGPAVGAPVRLLPRRRGAAAPARRARVLPEWRRGRPAPSLRARPACLRPRGVRPLRRGRGGRAARARRRRRACRGRSTPSRT